MRVLQVNSVCGRGSTGRIAVGIANRLAERGDQCTIAHGRGEAIGWADTLRIGSPVGVLGHQLAARTWDASGFASGRATRRFLEQLDELAPDLIHLHNVHGYYLDVELFFAHLKQLGIPVVWTLHDVWSYTGHCAWYEQAGCYRWQDACGKCPQRLEYPRSWVVDRSRSNLARKREAFSGVPSLTVATPSHWLKGQAEQSFLAGYPIEVIPNEVDLETFQRTPSDFRARHGLGGKHVVLAVANAWGPPKGLQHIHDLAPLMRDDEALVVVGLTSRQSKEMAAGVIALPRTNSAQDLAEIYSAADVFINPTMDDISSMTNLEAVACGLPVVTFRTGGAAETIDNMAGVVIDDRTAAGLRDGIDKVRSDGRDNVGAFAGQRGAVASYQGYLDLYDRVAGQPA